MSSTFEKMTLVLEEVFERPLKLRPDMSAADIVGWDSFKHVEILMELEERYDIELPTSEVANTKTLGDLASLIDRKLAA